jgi:hypothetical protein
VYLSDQATAEIETLLEQIAQASGRIHELLGGSTSPGGPLGEQRPSADGAGEPIEFSVVDARPITDRLFTYRWPDSMERKKYTEATRYTVHRDSNEYVFVVGTEDGGRPAYRRADRGRIVVFLRQTASSNSYYPLLEFAQSDLGDNLYAALIPKPGQVTARATMNDLDAVRRVAHLRQADIRRADEVFDSSANAPTLRVLVRSDDFKMLITHAWWVGRLRRTAP